MSIRNRVKELRFVRADQLRPHPHNWRTHPAEQRACLEGALAELGYAQALLARETSTGELELIDGHLRAETTPTDEVPVLVLDVNATEAQQLLATLDSLTGLAGIDRQRWQDLREKIEFSSPALCQLMSTPCKEQKKQPKKRSSDAPPQEVFQLLVDCGHEDAQRQLYERLRAEGWSCRVLVL